jgi:hypothetical protein
MTVGRFCSCGLASLQWLQWPSMPHSIDALFAETWPKLLVNQSTPPTHVACQRSAVNPSSAHAANIAGERHSAEASAHMSLAWQGSTGTHGRHDIKSSVGSQVDAAIDAPMAALVSEDAWRDIAPSEEEEFMKLHIAERFLRACQDVERVPHVQHTLVVA